MGKDFLKTLRILGVALVFLGACQGESCDGGEKIVVVYRGGSTIDEQGLVEREKQTVGFVEDVLQGRGSQRIVIRVKDASTFRRNDRFLPLSKEGKVGFRVIPGGGDPLDHGAVISDGFSHRRMDPSPQQRRTEAWSRERPAGRQPEKRGDMAGGEAWYAGTASNDLASVGIDAGELEGISSEVVDEVKKLPVFARSLPPKEAVEHLTERKRELKQQFAEEIDAAKKSGDHESAAKLRGLSKKTERMITRMRAQASKAAYRR